MVWTSANGPKCPVSPADRGEFMKPTNPALLPCPFCGAAAEFFEDGYGLEIFCASDDEVCAVRWNATGDSRKRAAEKWNTRSTPSSVSTPAQDATALMLESGKHYSDRWGHLHGPMDERTEGVFLDQHGAVYQPDGRQWNHRTESMSTLISVVDPVESTPSSVSTPAQDATALADKIENWSPDSRQPLTLIARERRQIVAALRATSQTPDAARNWTEDASHENGNYECRCVECGQMFIGHKRRVLCKACSGLLTPSASAQTPDAVRIASDFWMTISPDKEILRANVRAIGQNIADAITNALRPTPSASAGPQAAAGTFQQRVDPWLMECFGLEIACDILERNHRFLEEALEAVQANGCTVSEAHQLVDYVFGRDQGDINQEVGGVMVTLAALCLASGVDMHAAAETELARVWTKVEKIRAKHFAKPKFSPLPGYAHPQPQQADGRGAVIEEKRWPQKGDQMTFLGKNGYPFELEEALKIFTVGNSYRVHDCDVGDWRHSIQFDGVSGRFNGVMFEFAALQQSDGPAK